MGGGRLGYAANASDQAFFCFGGLKYALAQALGK